MKNQILSLLIAGGVALAASTGSAQTHKWDLVNEYPANSVHAQAADRFIEALKETAGGDIQVTAHHGSALGYKSLDQFDAVGDGAVELASSFVGPWGGIDPIFLLPSLPFLAPTVEDTRALYEASRPYYERVLDNANQVFLYATPWPPSGIWANKPVDSMDALKDLRIRTYDASGTVTMRAAGASPIQLSWADTVPQLTTGGIDAVLTSADGGAAAQLWEHQSHFTEVNYAMPLQIVHINKDVFEGLSEEQQKAVRDAAAQTEEFGWNLLGARVQENYDQMKANGMTIVTDVDPGFIQSLTQAAEEAVNDWKSKFPESEALLAGYQAKRAN